MNQVIAERSVSGEPIALFGVSMDVTDYENALLEISHTALHDPLTSLANRTKFNDRLGEALDRTKRGGRHVAVVLLDLDHFKYVNDTLGHPVGDQLLISFAQRMREQIRETETLARLGGDEFAVIQILDQQPTESEGLCNRILNILREPFQVDGHQLSVSASVGVAIAPTDGLDTQTLLRNADIALYRAKNEGRSTYRFFESEMDTRLRERRQLEIELKAAIENDEFVLYYQPAFDTRTKRLCSLEALIRWNSPTRGLISPDKFLPLAEQTNLILPIGQWVLGKPARTPNSGPKTSVSR